MFEIIIEVFIYIWIVIIAAVPSMFMGWLTICIFATLYTYLEKRKAN